MSGEGCFGRFDLAIGDCLRWQTGPLTLVVARSTGEWRLWRCEASDPDRSDFSLARLPDVPQPPQDAVWERYVTTEADAPLVVAPLLPDRPIVSRPRDVVFVPPGETVRVFVSVPLWLGLSAGRRPLTEIPTHRPSDTWFGPSTVEGQVCYALRTRFRLEAHAEPAPAWRAVVAVTVRNEDEAAPAMQRLNVPVPLLALFRGADGRFWSESVTIIRESGETAQLRLGEAPPPEAVNPTRVSPARQVPPRRTMFHALGALLGS